MRQEIQDMNNLANTMDTHTYIALEILKVLSAASLSNEHIINNLNEKAKELDISVEAVMAKASIIQTDTFMLELHKHRLSENYESSEDN